MKFQTIISAGREVLFVGHEAGNSKPVEAWLASGRWRISKAAVDTYLSNRLEAHSFGDSIDRFVFCFEIADFERWGAWFEATADFVSYKPKKKEIWSVGEVRWSDVKDLAAMDQLRVLRAAIQTAIERVGSKKRRPKDFDHPAFALAVEKLLEQASEDMLAAKPALKRSQN
jgi:hypothetical protein